LGEVKAKPPLSAALTSPPGGGDSLMHRARYLVTRQGHDHPLDLAPVAEADDIAAVAGAFGQHGRFERRIVAERVDQPAGIGQRGSGCDEGLHGRRLTSAPPKEPIPDVLEKAFTMFSWQGRRGTPMGGAMQDDSTKATYAGGCLIFLGFLAGAVIGILRGEPSAGTLIGVGAGLLVALIVWLVARRRRG